MRLTKKLGVGLITTLLIAAFAVTPAQAKRHTNPQAKQAQKRAKAQRKAMRRAAKKAQKENRQRAGTHY